MQREDAPRVGQQAFTLGGGDHMALVAVEQLAAGDVFQAADLLAHGGLGQVQALGGAGEVAALHHGDKAA